MNKKYWVKKWGSEVILGPFTLREALSVKEKRSDPCEILKTVIDINGKEVK